MAPDVVYFFPLVNLLTTLTKRLVLPRLAPWAWPLVNVVFGSGVAAAAHAAGLTADPAVQSFVTHVVRDGVLTAGAATIAYETGTRLRRRGHRAGTRSRSTN